MTVNYHGFDHQVIDTGDQMQQHAHETPRKERCYDKHRQPDIKEHLNVSLAVLK